MLSRTLRRALLDTRWQIPPTFLLPWAATLTTASQSTQTPRPPPITSNTSTARDETLAAKPPSATSIPSSTQPSLPTPKSSDPGALYDELSPSVRDLLPILHAQGPHYISAHIHDRPYLVTQGDTIKLPFRMHGVEPGDILRLNCASLIGSRDYTLKASAAAPALRSATAITTAVIDPTSGGDAASHSRVMPEGELAAGENRIAAPHFIPHIQKGKISYLDERLFVCRAVVMGVESEPMLFIKKTKRRQRKVKTVKHKTRCTVLRIKEVRVRSLEEIEEGRFED